MTADAPLVRDEHGAILGIDWRRHPAGDPSLAVPGQIPARAVMPGDTVRTALGDAVVLTRRANGAPGVIYLGTRCLACGTVTVLERRVSEVLDVVAVGAFDV